MGEHDSVRRLSAEGHALFHPGRYVQSWLLSPVASKLLIATGGRGFNYKENNYSNFSYARAPKPKLLIFCF